MAEGTQLLALTDFVSAISTPFIDLFDTNTPFGRTSPLELRVLRVLALLPTALINVEVLPVSIAPQSVESSEYCFEMVVV